MQSYLYGLLYLVFGWRHAWFSKLYHVLYDVRSSCSGTWIPAGGNDGVKCLVWPSLCPYAKKEGYKQCDDQSWHRGCRAIYVDRVLAIRGKKEDDGWLKKQEEKISRPL